MKQLVILLLALPACLAAQQPAYDSLDAFIAKEVAAYKIPALAIGIIKNNQVVFKKGYGVTSTVDGVAVTTKTVFPIASCTKAFTAAAMGILADEGKLQWNDKVIKYLPDFALSDPWITKELTISDILSHRSGLESFEGDLLWYGSSYSRQEVVRRIRYSAIRNQFRIDFGYQNVMFLVAGLIIEKITGLTWDQFVKEKLFVPLGMQNSSTSITALQQPGSYAIPHIKNLPVPLLNLDNIAPAGAVNSTIDDLCTWVQLWTGQGRIQDQIILNESSYEAITGLKTITDGAATKGYGFGWYITLKNGEKTINHNGGLPGIMSSIAIHVNDSTGIIVLTNKINNLNNQLISIISHYLISGKQNWEEADQSLMGKSRLFPWDKARDTTRLNPVVPHAASYTGIYSDKAYGKAAIKIKENRLLLQLSASETPFTGTLYYTSPDTCTIIFNDAFVPPGEIIFERNAAHTIKGFTMNIDTNDFLFKYLHFIRQPEHQ